MAEVDQQALAEGAKEVARKLRGAGFEAYFAGGCVRDLLRGEAPKDFDVVTDATPDEVTALFKRTVQVGAAFGVVRVLIDKGREYEVATYRRDVGYSDGRRPDEVHYSRSKEEDVKRRDFTINALLMDPERGEVIDLVGGRDDLARGVIRAVGDPDARFGEDRLRMLRAVRFAARFGFAIEDETMRVIEKHAGAIGVVSIERIVVELEGIWTSRDPARGLELLERTGLAPCVLPAPAAPQGAEVIRERLRRIPNAAAFLEKRARADVAWAAIFERSLVDDLEKALYARKLARADMRLIQSLVAATSLLRDPLGNRKADRVRVVLDRDFAILRAYMLVIGGDEKTWDAEAAELDVQPLPPLPLLGGGDLMKLGYVAGPRFKEILGALEIETFERRLTTREAAVAWVRSTFPNT